MLNLPKNGNYNPNLVRINKIQKIFLCVYHPYPHFRSVVHVNSTEKSFQNEHGRENNNEIENLHDEVEVSVPVVQLTPGE